MNHLANQTSPYLLQHADNPVDWYPWGEEALEKAKREDKPILLSIGYASCHWCHVMAHESFEDHETAQIMNDGFVNIKVDREERPDLDQIYQLVHQLLNQRPGGWPLTVFMTPDQVPFFSGTYFPLHPHPQLPDFKSILRKVLEVWKTQRQSIDQQSQAIQQTLNDVMAQTAPKAEIDKSPADKAYKALVASYDKTNGGFGGAPKFPPTSAIHFILRYREIKGNDDALAMVEGTLNAMGQRGLYDHIRGGFFRYCVDKTWEIPHFEKMLYDNAQLLDIYSEAYALTGYDVYRDIVLDTRDWLFREMAAPEGGFYTALDADTEGEEGKFYRWDREEVDAQLTSQESEVVKRYYGLAQSPNYHGSWHLGIQQPLEEVAKTLDMTEKEARHLLNSARKKLFEAQDQRTKPDRDDKRLTMANSLTAASLAKISLVLNDSLAQKQSEDALEFIQTHLYQQGRLAVSYKDGDARFPGFLDDYAFLMDALFMFLQVKWRNDFWYWLLELAQTLEASYWDQERGGFYYTPSDHEALIYRPKDFGDTAIPSGNAVAAQVYTHLGYLTGHTEYLNLAERVFQAGWSPLERYPEMHCTLASALLNYIEPPTMIVVRAKEKTIDQWQDCHRRHYQLNQCVFYVPVECEALPDVFETKAAQDQGVAYVCRGWTCESPIVSLKAFESYLEGKQ